MSISKTFVITGITGGIGLALTRRLLRDGHRVHGCGRREDPLAETERDRSGNRYGYHQLDIMDFEALRHWANEMDSAGQTPDYLIHNAALIHGNAHLWEIDRDRLKTVIDVNIMGTFNVLQAFLPSMLKQRRGIIITLSSGAGRMGIGHISGYCATKWAVEGLTKSLAEELPAGMAAIPMSPGMVNTDMLRTNFGEQAGNYQSPEDWADVAAPFILGLDASQTGQSLTVPDSGSPAA